MLVECAQGKFPYQLDNHNNNNNNNASAASFAQHQANRTNTDTANNNNGGVGFWELLDFIVKEPPPQLPRAAGGAAPSSTGFSPQFCDFVDQWYVVVSCHL